MIFDFVHRHLYLKDYTTGNLECVCGDIKCPHKWEYYKDLAMSNRCVGEVRICSRCGELKNYYFTE